MSAVLAAAGGELLQWRTRQVDYQQGSRTTVSYAARVRWTDGSETDETLGACDGELPAATARLSDGTTEIGMWRFPFDPDLPGLPMVCDPARIRRLAAEVGVGAGARVRLRAYRPRRRAVVQVTTDKGSALVKVVRPSRVEALHERHRAATEAGCAVPESLAGPTTGWCCCPRCPARRCARRCWAAGRCRWIPTRSWSCSTRCPPASQPPGAGAKPGARRPGITPRWWQV